MELIDSQISWDGDLREWKFESMHWGFLFQGAEDNILQSNGVSRQKNHTI